MALNLGSGSKPELPPKDSNEQGIGLPSSLKEPSPTVQPIAPPPEKKKAAVVLSGGKLGGSGALGAVLAEIRKKKGEGIAMAGSQIPVVGRIPTGVFEFDLATGGGFPKSRYSIVYGPESSGKTNLVLRAIANAQRTPPPCNKAVLIDLEGTFDPTWAKQLGVDVDELVVLKPGYGEEAGDLLDAVIRAEDVAIVALDSLAVMVSSKEAEQSLEKFDVGTSSLLIKRMMNKVVIALSEEYRRGHEPAVVFVNQTRFKIGVMFGDPETMPGGQAMKFLCSLTVRLHGKNKIDKSVNPDMPAYKETSAVIKKAKVGVTNYAFNYDMAMIPHNGLGVGDTNSWNLVQAHLKQMGQLVKTAKGWELLGVAYPTLSAIEDMYQAENDFMLKLQGMVIDSYKDKMVLIGDPTEGS